MNWKEKWIWQVILSKKFKRGQATQANINELLRLLKEDEKNFIDPSAKNTHQTAKVSALNKASGTNSTASMKSPREKKRRNVRNKREGKNQRKKLEEIIEVQERNDTEESKEGTSKRKNFLKRKPKKSSTIKQILMKDLIISEKEPYETLNPKLQKAENFQTSKEEFKDNLEDCEINSSIPDLENNSNLSDNIQPNSPHSSLEYSDVSVSSAPKIYYPEIYINGEEKVYPPSNIEMEPDREPLKLNRTPTNYPYSQAEDQNVSEDRKESRQGNQDDQHMEDETLTRGNLFPTEGQRVSYYLSDPKHLQFFGLCQIRFPNLTYLELACSDIIYGDFFNFARNFFPNKIQHLKWSADLYGNHFKIDKYHSLIISTSDKVEGKLEINKFSMTQAKLEELVANWKQGIKIHFTGCEFIIDDYSKFYTYWENHRIKGLILDQEWSVKLDNSITSTLRNILRFITS